MGQATTTRPILLGPSLRAVAALVVVVGAPVGTTAGELLVTAPAAPRGGFVIFIVDVVVIIIVV
jgi:hypothetical protein